MRRALLVVAAMLFVAATPGPTPLPGPPCPSPVPPRPEARHVSGIALPTPLPHCYGPPVYEPLALAHQSARYLAESHPNDFGYPWDDRARRELLVSVTGPTGEALARAWMASGATYAPPGAGAKSTFLAQPVVPVRFRTVTRSYAQLEKLQNDIGDALRAGPPDVSAVRSWGHDDEYNRIVIDVQYLSDAFVNAFVARFGTEAIAIRVDPTYGPWSSTGRALDSSAVDPLLVAALVGGSLLGVGLAVFVMKRRPADRV